MIRLFELRTEKGLSQRDMAREMQISQGTYNNWENEKTQPSIEQLIMLSKFFAVSVDYIVGNTDEYGTVYSGAKLTGEEERALGYFRTLSAEGKSTLLAFLDVIRS